MIRAYGIVEVTTDMKNQNIELRLEFTSQPTEECARSMFPARFTHEVTTDLREAVALLDMVSLERGIPVNTKALKKTLSKLKKIA